MASYVLICAMLLVCFSLLIATAITGVPSLSSSALAAQDVVSLLREAKLPQDMVIYEMGSGWGSLALALARAFPDAQIRGIEISPFPYLVSRLRALRHANVQFEWGDFNRRDLSDADAITCYLMPGKMAGVADCLDVKVRRGVLVVSIEFWFRDRRIAASRRGTMREAVAMYVWPADLQ